jgi:putative thioredoxin
MAIAPAASAPAPTGTGLWRGAAEAIWACPSAVKGSCVATLGLSEAERDAVAKLQSDVIEPSMTKLVLLDFWAEWCGPCKQLSPVLEKIASDYAGKGVALVKIDVEADKIIAAQFRVQSIPTVYAFYQGQPIADLTNYRTESELTRVIDQLIAKIGLGADSEQPKPEIGPLIAMGEEVLAGGDTARAVNVFRQVRELVPDHTAAIGGLVRALVANGDTEEARGILDGLEPDFAAQAPVVRARAALETAEAGAGTDCAKLERRVAEYPDDLQARFDLAGAKMAAGDRDRAADELLTIIERDRDWNEGAARQRFLQLLEAQGIEDQWARSQRRRLSALLFT